MFNSNPSTPSEKNKFRGVVFDLDGTLVSTQIDFDTLRHNWGVPVDCPILDWVLAQPELIRGEYHEQLTRTEIIAAEKSEFLPGARQTLEWLESKQIPVAVLTRNTHLSWKVVSERCGMQHLPVFTRESGPPKPDPRSLSPILDLFKLTSEQLVHVGDYLFDLELAGSSGMYSILLHSTGQNPFSVPCHVVVRDHQELLSYLGDIFY